MRREHYDIERKSRQLRTANLSGFCPRRSRLRVYTLRTPSAHDDRDDSRPPARATDMCFHVRPDFIERQTDGPGKVSQKWSANTQFTKAVFRDSPPLLRAGGKYMTNSSRHVTVVLTTFVYPAPLSLPKSTRMNPPNSPPRFTCILPPRSGAGARARHPQRGAAAIEFGLALPVLMGMTSAVLDLGVYLDARTSMVEAAESGARAAATTTITDGAVELGTTRALESLTTSMVSIQDAKAESNVVWDADLNANLVTITLTGNTTPLFGLLPMPTEITAQVTVLVAT